MNFSYQSLVLLEISLILKHLTSDTYIVGGAVRDYLLNQSTKDIDLVTDAPYNQMATAFTEAGWEVKEIGKHYLVLHIYKNGNHFEISNFRSDTANDGGVVGSMYSDALRRDFTINALYVKLGTDEIIDPTGLGLQDITSRTLRFVGGPAKRIAEDGLRVMRFYRFLHTKNLVPHKGSLRAVRQWYNEAQASTSPERWRTEIERMIGLL